MRRQALLRGAPEDSGPLPELSAASRRRYMAMRWLTLAAITIGVAFALQPSALWPGLPLFLLVLAAYCGLMRWQFHRRSSGGCEISLEPHCYLVLSALFVFALVVVGGPITKGQSLWYSIMYFVVLSEGRHIPTVRAMVAMTILCMLLTHLSVLLVLSPSAWLQGTLSFLPLDAGLAASAFGTHVQRSQELEHAARLILLQELEQSKERLEAANHQLQVYAGTVEQLAIANERNRLARDLHDILGYTLATVVVKAEAGKRLLLAADPDRVATELGRIQEVARTGLAEVRRSVAGLRDTAAVSSVWHEALTHFIDEFAQENGLRISRAIGCLPAPRDAALEMCLFRVIQESLTNVARHARASRVTISLVVDGDEERRIVLSVQDDGVGSDPAAEQAAAGYGLRGMRERVEQLGGQLIFSSRRAEGARVLAMVPLPRARTAAEALPDVDDTKLLGVGQIEVLGRLQEPKQGRGSCGDG